MAQTKKSQLDKKEKQTRAVVLQSVADILDVLDEENPKHAKKVSRDVRGRPTVMTKQVLAKLEVAFKIGATQREACTFAAIDQSTLHRFMDKNPDFANEIEDWQNDPVLAARSNIIGAIKESKSVPDSWGYLRAKRKKEFAEEKNVNMGVGVVKAADLEEAAERGVVADPTLIGVEPKV